MLGRKISSMETKGRGEVTALKDLVVIKLRAFTRWRWKRRIF